jgi:hypothetical protein
MHQSQCFDWKRFRSAMVGTIAAFVVVSPALAGEDVDEPSTVDEPRTLRSRDIVTRLDTLPESEPNWFRANIRTTKKHGFQFSRSIETRKREKFVFSIKGPMLRKKTPGLTFEIRF